MKNQSLLSISFPIREKSWGIKRRTLHSSSLHSLSLRQNEEFLFERNKLFVLSELRPFQMSDAYLKEHLPNAAFFNCEAATYPGQWVIWPVSTWIFDQPNSLTCWSRNLMNRTTVSFGNGKCWIWLGVLNEFFWCTFRARVSELVSSWVSEIICWPTELPYPHQIREVLALSGRHLRAVRASARREQGTVEYGSIQISICFVLGVRNTGYWLSIQKKYHSSLYLNQFHDRHSEGYFSFH